MNDTNVRKLAEKCNIHMDFKGKISFNESMASHTTFLTGGTAPLFIEPADEAALIVAVSLLCAQGEPFFILGGGSNIVVSDEGFDCPVISTRGMDAVSLSCTEEGAARLVCGAGLESAKFASLSLEWGLGGAEVFSGLPGTVGGAVFMNARCYGKEIGDIVEAVRFIDLSSGIPVIKTYTKNTSDWSYKHSPFQSGKLLILSASFCLPRLDPDALSQARAEAAAYMEDRRAKGHFSHPSAGSAFKNNRAFGKPSGMIIDEAGLKGCSVGGAQVAPWHGNFIINTGNARAADIYSLVGFIIDKVWKKTGLTLESEIIFCGRGYAPAQEVRGTQAAGTV